MTVNSQNGRSLLEIKLIDHMGSDLRVVNAARVSFKKEKEEFDERDERLIRYLASHNHFTPFTHPQITLYEKVPIFVARQRFKHTVGFTYNEVSRRYVDDEPEFYEPEVWRERAENVKQGSSDKAVFGSDIVSLAVSVMNDQMVGVYKDLLGAGVAPEQARMVLPQSMYTEYYVTGSLAAFARAYNLRSDPHAQMEIQEVAKMWDSIIRPLFPISWGALVNP